MLLVRHGVVVFEHYYGEFGPRSFFSVASVTKSVLSALVGIAFRDGLLQDVDQSIEEFFPGYRTHGLTLRDLLTLTAGWPYHDFSDRPETVPAMLTEPLAKRPGECFQYGETPPHLLSAILTRLTGASAADYAQHKLFEPLDMWSNPADWHDAPGTVSPAGEWPASGLPWKCDADGISNGGHGLHLTAHDMARFGLLYAGGGRSLLPSDWVTASTCPQSRGGSPMWMPYGWLWWTPHWHRGHAMLAAGFGGQAIYVNPEADVVIVLACKPSPGAAMDDWTVLNRYLIPAVV